MDNQPIYNKFTVTRNDGKDATGEKHHGCRYLVIDLDHDECAPRIVSHMVKEYERTRPEYAASLLELSAQLNHAKAVAQQDEPLEGGE